jgi:hypothetical protein
MSDPKKDHGATENRVWFTSDSELIELTEENTTPGKMSEGVRKALEKKYGRKTPRPEDQTPKGPQES